tara:strand:+ start:817 stop:4341 length:3525 start_codon:yes stop_codon:yes gene_type:complete
MAARRARARILDDPEMRESYENQSQGLTASQRDSLAIGMFQNMFDSRIFNSEIERSSRQNRASQRQQLAQEALQGQEDDEDAFPEMYQDDDDDDEEPAFIGPVFQNLFPPPVPHFFNEGTTVEQLLAWLYRHRGVILHLGAIFNIQCGDTWYTVDQNNFYDLYNQLASSDEFIEYGEMESDEEIVACILQGTEWKAHRFKPSQMQRNMNPDENAGAFLPYTHRIEDKALEELLAKCGLFREVDADNYTTNCLVHSLTDFVDDEVLQHIKTCVRHNTVPRKHLKVIGKKFNLSFVVHTDKDSHKRTYGALGGEKIELCLFKNHYFPYIADTRVSGFAIKNYDLVKARYPDTWKLKKSIGGSSYKKGITSMRLMKLLCLESTLVQKIDICNEEIWKTVYLPKVHNQFDNLNYHEAAVKPVHAKRGELEDKKEFHYEINNIKKNRRKILERPCGEETLARLDNQIETLKLGYKEQDSLIRSSVIPSSTIFFDFESCSQGFHKAYLVAWRVDGEDEIYTRSGKNCPYEFLEWIDYSFELESDELEVTLIAHNVSYDLSFLLEFLEPGSLKTIKKGQGFVSAEGVYKSMKIFFKDSYKLIPAPLRQFPVMFGFDYEKEIMPYDIYTHDRIENNDYLVEPREICEAYSQDFVDAMKPNIEKWDCNIVSDSEPDKWDMMKYSKMYCERDVELLSNGWAKFRTMSLDFFDIDINAKEILTVAGMSFRHLMKECFEDTYSVSGIVLEFIRRSTVGGQTQSARNKSMFVQKEILDQDKRSLYPSAMVELEGVPKGPPKVFVGEIPSDANYFFVEIEIQDVQGPDYDFPILAIRNADNVNEWTNDVVGRRVIVGKQTLQDLIDWNRVFEYNVIHGYYWNEGYNDKLSSTINHMYNRRDELKKEGNPAQLIYKLLMNSSYGRTGLKPIDDENVYIAPQALNRYIVNNHDRITRMNIMPNGDTRIMSKKPINHHYNQQHVASMILEKAKHLMRKCLLLPQYVESPLAGNIYYTDTDSIHISKDAWQELERLYKERFHEELEGKKLGQFHSDFDIAGTYQFKDNKLIESFVSKEDLMGGNLYSKELYICGKKAYLDVLTSDKNSDIELFHFRLKGIPSSSLIAKCEEQYDGDIRKLYSELLEGKLIRFTLKGMFKTGLDGKIKTICMDRQVQFNPIEPQAQSLDRSVF